MAEKTGGREPVTLARRPSFRKTLREHENSLPPEYLDALEQKRKQLDESIHKYIASKEREYKQYEREVKLQTRSNNAAAAPDFTQTQPSGVASSNGSLAAPKRRTGSESTQDAAQQQHSAMGALFASAQRQEPVSQTVDEDDGVGRPGTANLKDLRASAEREKDFVGLFTPQYLTLIDQKDERTLERTESAPPMVETSKRDTILDEIGSLPKADSETAMYAKYKRPFHLQLAKRTSSSGSSADGKLASALKSPTHSSLLRPKRKRVSLAVGDSIVAPSDNVPLALKNSRATSHSRTRSLETDGEAVPVVPAGTTAFVDFAKQPVMAPAESVPSKDAASAIATRDDPPRMERAPSTTVCSPSKPRRGIDPDGDLFDLEDESDNPMQLARGHESAIGSEEDIVPDLAGRIEHSAPASERTEVPAPSPQLKPGEKYTYDPSAGLVPEPLSTPQPICDNNSEKALHLSFNNPPSSSSGGGFSSHSSRQPTSPGFRRPTVESDPVFGGEDYFREEVRAVEEEVYGSSYSRAGGRGSFTGGSLGESYMARHAEEIMRRRGAKKEGVVR